MISKGYVKQLSVRAVFVVIFFKTMYDKTIIRFRFCDIRNNQGLSKCCQGYDSADNIYLDLDYSGSHKLTQ